MSVIIQCYSVIIDSGIIATGNGKEVFGGLNAIDKLYIYQLMSNVQISGSKINLFTDYNAFFHRKNDVSLAKELKKHMSKGHRKYVVIDQGKYKK